MAAIQGASASIQALGRQALGRQALGPAALAKQPLRDSGVLKARTRPAKAAEPQPEAQPQLRGDVDGDGAVSMRDAKALLMHLFGGEPQPAGWSNADLNGDGSVNLADAMALLSQLTSQNQPADSDAETPEPPAIQPAPIQPFISAAQVSRAYRATP